ncbi:MAG: hypothetical protein FWG20_07080, partial [Candidatus Cloacimonetes bacterium]|nr:hypothetical protein [Candidatus Cloacimonadota bacterium]
MTTLCDMEREKNNFYQRIDKFFSRFPQIEGFDYATSQTGSKIIVNRVAPSIKSILTSRAFAKTNKTVFYICKDDKIAEEVAEDTAVLNAEKSVFFIPDFETLPFEERSPHYMIRASRLSALTNLLISQNAIYTLSAKTLLRNIINPQYLTRSVLRIKIGAEYEMTELVKTLNNIGFEHNSQIEKVGQFSKRGGIIDIFSPNYPKPLRFDFFGDEVTSIKPFSVENQRSEKKNITEAVIIPCREVILNEEAMHSSLAGLITLKGFYEGIEQDIPLLYEGKHCLLDYIQPDKSLLILDNLPLFSHEKTSVLGLLHTYQSEINDLYKRITETDRQKSIPAPDRLILNENELQAYFKAFTVAYLNTGDVYTVDRSDNSPPILEGWTRSGRGGYTGSEGLPCHSERSEEPIPLTQTPTYTYDTEKSPDFHGDIEALIERIINLRQMYYTVFIQLENEGQHKRMQQLLADYLADVKFSIGVLHSGFISHDIKLAVFTDHEIFNRVKHRKMDLAFSKGEPIIDYDSLKPGDYIVHIDHGIGVYEGLRTLELSGKSMDCLCIQYAGSDKLYVPTWQLKLVSKYVSEEGATPIVHKIGTKTWDLTKQRAKKSIELVVDEIMNLYAERKLRKGISFKTDSEWQTEMEESFIYDDTPDQTTATAEIKKDMESSTPMERLLCGDVGFGKTEVAVRVAFKAVLSGYQVAVVVPTTLLAEQHYNV